MVELIINPLTGNMKTNRMVNKLNFFNKHSCKTIVAGFFLLLFHQSCGQDPFIDSLKSNLIHFNSITLQEKVYVHTDKEFYLTGETIWFKIYNIDALQNKPATTNKVAYVELFDRENKIVLHCKITLDNGSGNGSFALSSSVPSGTYLIRAYTSWMKNFPAQFYFQKELTIINTLKRPDWKSLDKKESYDIQFFPEGGNLVYGIKSKVAFKITDQYGKGVIANGIVVDEGNDTISRFQTLYFGMGNFNFIPSIDKKYHAIIYLNNGKQVTAALPTAFESGYVMNVEEKDTSHLSIHVKTASKPSSLLYLIVHSRNTVYLALSNKLTDGATEYVIDKNILADGISQLTIFNELKVPVCERLYFKRPQHTKAEIKSKEQFDLRSKVDLNLKLPIASGSKNNISVSVFQLDSLQSIPPTNIVNYLFLTSDLVGTVESPDFYFTDSSGSVEEAMDNLMLTQGWRRFKWEDVLNRSKPSFSFLPEYEGQLISGKIIAKRTNNSISNRLVWLSIPGKKFHLSNSLSSEKGELNFIIKNVYGPSEMILQTDTADADARIDILNPYSDQLPDHHFSHFNLSENDRDLLIAHSINSQLSAAFPSKLTTSIVSDFSEDSSQFY
ncbi:MAG: hypothetical protein ACJ748_10825, partial [Flavisolibacter sp.]